MKIRSLARITTPWMTLLTVTAVLSGCPMPGSPARPDPTPTPADSCFKPVEMAAPPPEVQDWSGQLPPAASDQVEWVLAPAGDKDESWLLMQVEPIRRVVVSLTKLGQSDRGAVFIALGNSKVSVPGTIGGPRPPNPPGHGELVARYFRFAMLVHRAREEFEGAPGKTPPVTNQR